MPAVPPLMIGPCTASHTRRPAGTPPAASQTFSASAAITRPAIATITGLYSEAHRNSMPIAIQRAGRRGAGAASSTKAHAIAAFMNTSAFGWLACRSRSPLASAQIAAAATPPTGPARMTPAR